MTRFEGDAGSGAAGAALVGVASFSFFEGMGKGSGVSVFFSLLVDRLFVARKSAANLFRSLSRSLAVYYDCV